MISNRSKITTAVLLASLVVLASCGNTIRGVGRDTASAVGATKNAAHNVAKAAQ
ncbi:entericidin [Rhizobium sp. C4]|uniref:entericidin domain-containing protein n=1 Tax=Rhizobium sp. C4 TaxID=1349800 RepID=UPI001E3E6A12|nr:entericidin [Rhizobium sp. C4]MCD2173289.1 entericidin [Rhizobium sp. C4]